MSVAYTVGLSVSVQARVQSMCMFILLQQWRALIIDATGAAQGIASGVPWLLRSTAVLMQLSHQCWQPEINGNSVFDIRSLMWDEWSYPEVVILSIVTLGTIRPEDSGAARNDTEFQQSIAQRNPSLRLSGHVWG